MSDMRKSIHCEGLLYSLTMLLMMKLMRLDNQEFFVDYGVWNIPCDLMFCELVFKIEMGLFGKYLLNVNVQHYRYTFFS